MLPLTCADCYQRIKFIIPNYVWLITKFYKFVMAHHWALFCCSHQLLKIYSVYVDKIIFNELLKLMSLLDLVVRIHFFFSIVFYFCKFEFNQPFYWLYSVKNLLVIQHLETLYFGGNHVKVVCERVWRNAQDCAIKQGLAAGSHGRLTAAKSCTRAEHAGELNSHASWSTTGQKSILAI